MWKLRSEPPKVPSGSSQNLIEKIQLSEIIYEEDENYLNIKSKHSKFTNNSSRVKPKNENLSIPIFEK